MLSTVKISDRARGWVLYALIALGFCLAFLAFFQPASNPDFFWHLSAGKFMLTRLEFPRADFLSWTRAGAPWVDFEWLSQVIYQLLWTLGGLRAEYALKILLLSGALAVFTLHMRLYRAGKWIYALAPLWTAALLPNLDIRPEIFTLIFFTLEFYLLEKIRLDASKPRTAMAFAAAIVGFALWGNLHAGCVYGAALACFFAAGEFITVTLPVVYGKPRTGNFGKTWLFALIALAGIIGPLINPYGAGIYRIAFAHLRDMPVLEQYIVEWQMPSLFNPAQRPYWFLIVAAFSILFWRAMKHRDVVPAHLLAVLYFGLASSQHSRHTMFFAMTAIPAAVFALRRLDASEKSGNIAHCAALIILLATGFHMLDWAHNALGSSPWRYSITASGTANYLEANKTRLSKLRMYNPWGWGGYLGYKLYPDYKIFQDGRYIFHDNLDTVYRAESSSSRWAEFIREKNVELVVMSRSYGVFHSVKTVMADGSPFMLKRPYYLFYMAKQEWALVYWDVYGMIFVRKDAVDKDWLEKNRFVLVRPDDGDSVYAALAKGDVTSAQLDEEFQRFTELLHSSGALGDTGKEFNQWKQLRDAAAQTSRKNR